MWTAEVAARAGHDVVVVSRSGHLSSTSAAAASVLVPLLPGDPRSEGFKRGVRWAAETLAHVKAIDATQTRLEVIPCYEFGLKGTVEYGFALSSLEYLDFAEFTVIELGSVVEGCDVALQFECHLCKSVMFLEWLHDSLVDMGR
jgi:hypothetical protein